MINLNNKTLTFLNGPQSAIDRMRLNGGATEGAFYLTDDTHRLYIGAQKASHSYEKITVASAEALAQEINALQSQGYKIYETTSGETDYTYFNGQGANADFENNDYYWLNTIGSSQGQVYPLPVNAGIEEVDNIGELPIYPTNDPGTSKSPESGDPTFYYIKNGNILCVYGQTSPGTPAHGTIGDEDYVPAVEPKYGWIQINSDTFIDRITIADSSIGPRVELTPNNTNENNNTPKFTFTTNTSNDVVLSKSTGTTTSGPQLQVNVKRAELAVSENASGNTNLGIVHYINNGTNEIPELAPSTDHIITLEKGDFIESIVPDNNNASVVITGKDQQIYPTTNSTNSGLVFTPGSNTTTLKIRQKSNDTRTTADTDPNWANNQYHDNIITATVPSITYGANAPKSTYNLGNAAGMSVYTIGEVNSLISSVKSATLSAGNAMRYKNTLDGAAYDGTEDNAVHTTINKIIYSSDYYNPSTIVEGGSYYKKDATGAYEAYTATENDATENYSGTEIYSRAEVVVGDTYRLRSTMLQDFIEADIGKFTADAQSVFGTDDGDSSDDLVSHAFRLHKGDLIIASANGWDIVPAGDEPSYTFKIGALDSENATNILLKDENDITTGQVKIDGNAPIVLTADTTNRVIGINHSQVFGTDIGNPNTAVNKGFAAIATENKFSDTSAGTRANSGPNSGFTTRFNAITAIDIDAYGHIAGYTKETINQNYLYKVKTSSASGGVNLTFEDAMGNLTPFNLRNTTAANSTVQLSISQASANGNTVNFAAELKWQSFN